jgi:hypothetical protein
MKRLRWGKACVLAASLGFLANGAAWGQSPQVDPSQIVVIRENGKPDRRCFIEQAYAMPDGKAMYYVRDMATGEPLRVIDARSHRNVGGPIVGTIVPHPNDSGMVEALAGSPFNNNNAHTPTPAELAGSTSQSQPPVNTPNSIAAGKATAHGESPVVVQLKLLKSGSTPTDRESAAMTLSVSKAHNLPEVVKAIEESAKTDSASSVRTCCVRCLYRISADDPTIVPIIKSLQADPNAEVAQTARKAMQEIGKRDSSQPNR